MTKIIESQAKLTELRQEAEALLGSDKIEEAKAKMAEAKSLAEKIDMMKELDAVEKQQMIQKAPEIVPAKDAVHEFAMAARAGFKNAMKEGTAADGGYIVPEDISTQINEFREARFALRDLVDVESVSTMSGARTFKTRATMSGFPLVSEAGAISAGATPQFSRLTYTIKKYAGALPVTNELLKDTDQNLVGTLTKWMADEGETTYNNNILAAIATKEAVSLSDLDGIKNALNVTLGAAFKNTSVIVTNDDGLQYLDTLKDENKRYMLEPSPVDPVQLRLRAGATTVPIHVVPNAILASAPVYAKTSDVALVEGKTYYTRSGSGTAESPYVYTPVASPDVSDIATYYEVAAYQYPFIIGDLKEGIKLFDRQLLTIDSSDVATIGDFNAYANDMTLYRAIMRMDVKVKDSAAFVNGYIQVALGN